MIPASVRQAFPYISDWTEWRWESPTRLAGPARLPGGVLLVALAPDHSHWMAQTCPDEPATRAETWAMLDAALGRDLAARDGCRAGTPVPHADDPGRCRWCGIAASSHEQPDGAGPTYQDMHVNLGGEDVTLTEVEAAMTVAAAEMRWGRRGRHPDD